MRPVRCCSRKLNGTRPEHAPAFRVLHTSDDVAIYPTRTSVSCSGTACACALPLGPRSCSCRGALDAYRDHRAECSTSGVLASGALPLERAVARVCARKPARNVALAAMNIDVPIDDARRIEVVCNGLPL